MLPDKPSLEDVLKHYGVDHVIGDPGSGRFPYGSGKQPFQHAKDFLTRYEQLKMENAPYTDVNGDFGPPGKTYYGKTAIAHQMGLSTTIFNRQLTAAKNEKEAQIYYDIKKLMDEGYGATEIARKLGLPRESTVRSKIEDSRVYNRELARNTADFLKGVIEERGIIDIGPGTENYLGIARTKLDNAIFLLEQEGYVTAGGGYKNPTDLKGEHNINFNVIGPKDMMKKDIYNPDKLNFLSIEDYNRFREANNIDNLQEFCSTDGGDTYHKRFEYPESLDSSRIMIRYAEDGGLERDGTIELRRNVPDLDLQDSNYAQVRILVDGDHYLKGMALYSREQDKIPPGIDVVFNTNKHRGTPPEKVFKECKKDNNGNVDPDNPFGSNIKDFEKGGQYYYFDKNGKEHLGLINKTREEGDWSEWQDKVPAQFLSKQTTQLAERQLNLAIDDKKAEFNDILALENPTLRKQLLLTFANDCDSAAVHLQAAALPRQKHQVILPDPNMKETECYAPNFNTGETLALVRYPHGGTFEIPLVKVNNNNKELKSWLKNADDCVVLNPKVAERLSGADFDGDTVMAIPTNSRIKITSTPELKGLKNPDGSHFDPKQAYGTKEVIDNKGNKHYYNVAGKEIKPMSEDFKQKQMGIITNLINDMTLKGANNDELAKAVRHSMVVIDAEKHKLDYRQSEKDNDINALKRLYQGHFDADGNYKEGASTLISRAKNEQPVVKRQGQPRINKIGNYDYDPTKPEGALIFKESDQKYQVKVRIKTINPKTGREKTEWIFANDSTPKSDKEAAKNNDISKVEEKIKKGSFFYYTGDGDNRRKVKVTPDDIVKISLRTSQSNQMSEVDDARLLISDRNTKMENLYANYANAMKALANQARKISVYTKGVNYSPNAAKIYEKEVRQLKEALDISEKNAPRERQAVAIATSRINAKKASNPNMTKDRLKKISQQEMTKARDLVGAKRQTIDISPKQWEAIQAGAVRKSTLELIFAKADLDTIREYATPKNGPIVSDSKKARIKAMRASGYTNAEIGEALGISASSVSKYANE